MRKTYKISGMTCQQCVDKVKKVITNLANVTQVTIQLNPPQATIDSQAAIDIREANALLADVGSYHLSAAVTAPAKPKKMPAVNIVEEKNSYKPLGLTFIYIIMVTLLVQYPFSSFSLEKWMKNFMAGFFIVFSFFKFLNLTGFANAYALYDIIAKRWYYWGYFYPLLELSLGLCYLTSEHPFYLHIFSAIFMGINSIGVIQSNLNKQKIQCACLGDVFNLPMSKITIIENISMMLMALVMFFIV